MVRTNLRHFLLVTLLLISNITITNPTTETGSQTAYQQKIESLQSDLLSIQQVLSPTQFECLQAILNQFQAYSTLLLIDESSEEAAINALLAAQGHNASKEDVAQIKKIMLLVLEQQQIPLPIAQKFFATLLEMRNLQKQAGITPEETAVPQKATQTEDEKKAQIAHVLMNNGAFAPLFVLDPEKDSAKIDAYFTQAKKLQLIPDNYDNATVLAQFKTAQDRLLSSGITKEEIQVAFKEIKAQCTEQIALQIKSLLLPINFITLSEDKLEPLAQELSKKHDQEISVEMVKAKQHELQAQKFAFNITTKEIRNALETITAEQSKHFWRKYGLAALTATGMGTADLLMQTPHHIAKASGSILNKIFGTTVFYRQDNPSKIYHSPEGLVARMLQLISTIPAAILYKENSFDKLLNTQDPSIRKQFADLGTQFPKLKQLAKIAPLVIQTVPGQKQMTVNNAFAEICGPRMGAANAVAWQKFAPLFFWIAYQAQKNRAIIQSTKNFFDFVIQKDRSNSWSSAAFTTAPLIKELLSAPLDRRIGRLAPKNGVFWRSLANAGWGSQLVEIAYQTGIRHQAWKLHNNQKDELWIKPDFGETHKKTKRTTTYTQNGQQKKDKQTFIGDDIPAEKTSNFAGAFVKQTTKEAFMSECPDMMPEEMAQFAPKTTSFWSKDSSDIIQGEGTYKTANEAAISYAVSQLKNLLTKQVTKSTLVAACFALNDKIAKFGTNLAQRTARIALSLGLIKKSTHKGLVSGAKNIQEFVHIGTGLWTFLQSNLQNPNELLQNPEALAQIMDKLQKEGLNAVSPQTQIYQVMVHRMFVEQIYKYLIQNGLHKAIPTWVNKGEWSNFGTNWKKEVSGDNLMTRLFGKTKDKNYLNKWEGRLNNAGTVGKLVVYTTAWLAATSILSYKPESKKPVRKKTAPPKPVNPVSQQSIDDTVEQPTIPTPTTVE